ncbi:Glycosyltransferase involved in cell wall bisynthesis [Agromyces sp. CF514]|uniref:glycosyltransferase family 4 protein n=1 Tax=Agromyces sp. CF514 TaxID=1881031 RepID=UPI0008E89719|nr:glycosyltransferase family 1 protein [Agromyces sp. CF514]SFR86291.1 Glycosyltransferase involved in cell wall bisynthesis [Agromyces sp. CF514]
MTTTLRLVVDQLVAPAPGALGRYTADLARALVATAPAGCEVAGIVSSSPESDYAFVRETVPGLSELYKTSLSRRELAAAWQLGVGTSPGGGFIHAPSLLAPLRRHRRDHGDQVVVTVHDLLAWTSPESLSASAIAWQKAVMKRAHKHADAVVVPTHALAEQLASFVGFTDRIRVIPTAPRSGLVVGDDAAGRRARLGLPSAYLVAAGTLEPRYGIGDLLNALARPGVPDLPLVLLGPDSSDDEPLETAATDAGLAGDRIRRLDGLDPADLAAVVSGSLAFVAPSHDDGSGTALIEAFALGVPVVHAEIPAYSEIAGGAALSVPIGVGDGFADRLASAVTRVVEDHDLARRLTIAGHDRSKAFTWRDSAERVWQLHADL